MIKITSPQIFFNKIKKINITGSFLFEDDDSSIMENYTIPYEQRRIEFQPESFKLADNTDDTSLSLYLRRIPIFKDLKRKTIQELYLKDELVSLNGLLVKLQHICENYYQEQAIQVFDINYNQAIDAGFHPERLEGITEVFKEECSNRIINDIVRPYELWLEKMYRCVSINKTLTMARKAIHEFTDIAPISPPSRKTKVKNSFKLISVDYEVKLAKLFAILVEGGWIASSTDISDFNAVFSVGDPLKIKVSWEGNVGELKEFLKLLIDRNFIDFKGDYCGTAEMVFTKVGFNNLRQSLSDSRGVRMDGKFGTLIDNVRSLVKKTHQFL